MIRNIKTKLINNLIRDGKKETSEKNLFKTIKELQKKLSKNPIEVLHIAVINSTPVFKICTFKNKKNKKRAPKERPVVIKTEISKVSSAIKIIISNVKKKEKAFYKKFAKEILENSKKTGLGVIKKNYLQNKAFDLDRVLFKFL